MYYCTIELQEEVTKYYTVECGLIRHVNPACRNEEQGTDEWENIVKSLVINGPFGYQMRTFVLLGWNLVLCLPESLKNQR